MCDFSNWSNGWNRADGQLDCPLAVNFVTTRFDKLYLSSSFLYIFDLNLSVRPRPSISTTSQVPWSHTKVYFTRLRFMLCRLLTIFNRLIRLFFKKLVHAKNWIQILLNKSYYKWLWESYSRVQELMSQALLFLVK